MPKASTFALRTATQMIDSDTFPMITNAGDNVRLPVSEARSLVGPGYSATVNAYNEAGITDEIKIQAAITKAISTGADRVFVPTSMLPYDGSVITFNNAVQMVREGASFDVYDVLAYGAACDGVVDDTVAITACKNAAADSTMSVVGFPLVSSTIEFDQPLKLVFDGGVGALTPPTVTYPGSYFIKAGTMTTPAILISTPGFTGYGGGVNAAPGNTGDNIQITGWGATWYNPFSIAAGNDGIRIGKNTTGGFSNGFFLIGPCAIYNGRRGIFVDDFDNNANAGTIIKPEASNNFEDGIVFDRGSTNAVVGVLAEGNTGWGIHLLGRSVNNVFTGGDSEANTAGDIKTETTTGGFLGRNQIIGVSSANVTDLATGTVYNGPYNTSTINQDQNINGIPSFNGATRTGSALGDLVVPYQHGVRGADSFNSTTYGLILLSGAQQVLVDPNGRGMLTGANLAVATQFSCNGKGVQGSATVNAAATDLPTNIALTNQIRAALIANGICV